MSAMLPEELLLTLNQQMRCRELQIRQLAIALHPSIPSPPTLIVHGLEATGKSLLVEKILGAIKVSHTIVRSLECITTRHLLERALAACKESIARDNADEAKATALPYGSCETVSVLAVQLKYLLASREKFVLVFDGIDRQREAPPTLLPAIARLGEIIPNLTVVLIVTFPRNGSLHMTGVPYIQFPPYNRSESVAILSCSPLPIFSSSRSGSPTASRESPSADDEDDCAWLWSRFCTAVWDSLAKGAARDILSFESVCHRLWRSFVRPIQDGTYGTRDFSKLMVRHRALFQSESVLLESIVPLAAPEAKPSGVKQTHELPYYSIFLLFAAYLASYNPARQDQVFFMKLSDKKRRKKGGGTAVGRVSKHRKIQRKLLGPQAFVLERMLAIFHAILPHQIVPTADIMAQVATLTSLRLLVRTSGTADPLEAQTKWRINVGWEYVQQLARTVRFDIESYLAE